VSTRKCRCGHPARLRKDGKRAKTCERCFRVQLQYVRAIRPLKRESNWAVQPEDLVTA
jgi:hypothetical protein